MVNIIIVVPMYKKINELEEISLKQLYKVLGKYEICFVLPESISFKKNREEFFPDSFFKSTKAYSSLLMSTEFYQRFASYDYMLIYQLDAFVFKDQLNEFCSLEYDYIGAPVPIYAWPMSQRVGNGGLSLRKINSVLRLLMHRHEILAHASMTFTDSFYKRLQTTEDIFFSYSGSLPDYNFKIAPFEIAAKFSVEFDVGHKLYANVNKNLPFGCHRWYAGQIDFWEPYISACGYELSSAKEKGLAWGNGRRLTVYSYLMRRLLFSSKKDIQQKMQDVLSCDLSYSIWGAGKLGNMMIKILNIGGYTINKVFDSELQKRKGCSDYIIEQPTKLSIKDAGVIIVSIRDDINVCRQLKKWGLKENGDYIRLRKIEEENARRWFRRILKCK